MQLIGNSVKDNFQRCLEKIANVAAKCNQRFENITLVAVTKTVSTEKINQGIEAGITNIGENKVQEAKIKKDLVKPVTWHMVGHLQTNKVKHALQIFDMIQSVDSIHLAKEVNKRSEQLSKKMPVLIEVNTSREASKYGCSPETTIDTISEISQMPFIEIRGLMTIGLFTNDRELIRPCFILLRELADKIKSQKIANVYMDILSMGMSADFETAIEEGSNMVRIGTAIFGPRNYLN